METQLTNNTTMLKAISTEQILANAPAVLESTYKATLSSKYTHIPTSVLMEDMAKLGWVAVKAQQQNSRDENKRIHKKHLVTFRNPNVKVESKEGDDIYPQILIMNSHDGTSSFQFRVGIFRVVCSNGLVICTEDFGKTTLRHSGYSFEHLQSVVRELTNNIPKTIEMLNVLNKVQLDEHQQQAFVQKAMEIRFGKEIENIGFDSQELLKSFRKEDDGNTIWKILNRVQERLVNGTFHYSKTSNQTKKYKKARSIKNFKRDVELNERLFKLAYEYAN
jgi:hypothetical protein